MSNTTFLDYLFENLSEPLYDIEQFKEGLASDNKRKDLAHFCERMNIEVAGDKRKKASYAQAIFDQCLESPTQMAIAFQDSDLDVSPILLHNLDVYPGCDDDTEFPEVVSLVVSPWETETETELKTESSTVTTIDVTPVTPQLPQSEVRGLLTPYMEIPSHEIVLSQDNQEERPWDEPAILFLLPALLLFLGTKVLVAVGVAIIQTVVPHVYSLWNRFLVWGDAGYDRHLDLWNAFQDWVS